MSKSLSGNWHLPSCTCCLWIVALSAELEDLQVPIAGKSILGRRPKTASHQIPSLSCAIETTGWVCERRSRRRMTNARNRHGVMFCEATGANCPHTPEGQDCCPESGRWRNNARRSWKSCSPHQQRARGNADPLRSQTFNVMTQIAGHQICAGGAEREDKRAKTTGAAVSRAANGNVDEVGAAGAALNGKPNQAASAAAVSKG
jgi:hypothetical protein